MNFYSIPAKQKKKRMALFNFLVSTIEKIVVFVVRANYRVAPNVVFQIVGYHEKEIK